MAMNCALLSGGCRAAVVVVASLWLSTAVCSADDVGSADVAPGSDAFLPSCPGQEVYEWCFAFLSDCNTWTSQSPQQDSCLGGGIVSTVCGPGNNYVSFVCP